jgi:hypothetical protein
VEGLFLNFIYSDMKYLRVFEGFVGDYYQRITMRDFEVYQFGEDNTNNKRVDFETGRIPLIYFQVIC